MILPRCLVVLEIWVFSILLSSLLCHSKGLRNVQVPHALPASFVFGDSLVDAGNNNYINSLAKANSPANGIDFPGGTPTGRFSNGRTVADIVECGRLESLFPNSLCHLCNNPHGRCLRVIYRNHGQLLGLPFAPPYLAPTTRGAAILKGVNYASGGSGILDFTGYNFVGRIPLTQQINNFRKTKAEIFQLLGPTAGAELIRNSLYSVTIGSNDFLNNYMVVGSPSPKKYTLRQFQDMMINTYRKQLHTLVALGGRKFVISNTGPLGCIPFRLTYNLAQGGACVQKDNNQVASFNAALRLLIDELNANFTQTRFVLANAFDVVASIVNNPSAFGISVRDQACCGLALGQYHGVLPCFSGVSYCSNRKDYLFWDAYHPSDAANSIIGNRFFSGGRADIYPMNIRDLCALPVG